MNFKKLHKTEKPLLICNVWDVKSAKIAEKSGYKAIGTSSGAIATMLGYNDGEEMSFEELFYIVKRIKANTSLPLSVDFEAGYSRNLDQIIKNLNKLISIGITAINIEDSIVSNERKLVESDGFSILLKNIIQKTNNQLFINVRTDTYLLNIQNKLEETLKRIKKYTDVGANGIFIPCITSEKDINIICQSTNTPINVMCMPELSDFENLYSLGVSRISMGNFVYNSIQNNLENKLTAIKKLQSFKNLF